jgi:hypothetical protein
MLDAHVNAIGLFRILHVLGSTHRVADHAGVDSFVSRWRRGGLAKARQDHQ